MSCLMYWVEWFCDGCAADRSLAELDSCYEGIDSGFTRQRLSVKFNPSQAVGNQSTNIAVISAFRGRQH